MKTITILILSTLLYIPIVNAQEVEKPVKVPSFIIFNKFTNKESYKLIRWITWTDDQKLKIFLYTNEQFKDDKTPQADLALKVQNYIESLETEDQKKEYAEKIKTGELLKTELNKILVAFDEKTKELKSAPFDKDLYDILNATKFFHFPEIWALTRTPLSDKEYSQIMDLISLLEQMEQGYHYATGKNSVDLNIDNGYCLFDFNMKKDHGTEALKAQILKLSKPNQEIFKSLVLHYITQKKTLLDLYQKYGEKTKFEILMAPPKIIDAPANK